MNVLNNSIANKYNIWGLIRPNMTFWCFIFLAFILLLGTLFIIIPSVANQISDVQNDTVKVRDRLSMVESYQEAHSDYIAYEDDLAKELEYRHRLLPQELTVALIMGELQQKAIGAGVELTGIKPNEDAAANPGQKKKKNSSVAISLSIRGTYFQCLDFIHSIISSGQLLRVQNLQVNSDAKRSGIICKLDITAYGDS